MISSHHGDDSLLHQNKKGGTLFTTYKQFYLCLHFKQLYPMLIVLHLYVVFLFYIPLLCLLYHLQNQK